MRLQKLIKTFRKKVLISLCLERSIYCRGDFMFGDDQLDCFRKALSLKEEKWLENIIEIALTIPSPRIVIFWGT